MVINHGTFNKMHSISHKVPSSMTHSPIKYVINVFPNVRSQAQELAVDAMKGRL